MALSIFVFVSLLITLGRAGDGDYKVAPKKRSTREKKTWYGRLKQKDALLPPDTEFYNHKQSFFSVRLLVTGPAHPFPWCPHDTQPIGQIFGERVGNAVGLVSSTPTTPAIDRHTHQENDRLDRKPHDPFSGGHVRTCLGLFVLVMLLHGGVLLDIRTHNQHQHSKQRQHARLFSSFLPPWIPSHQHP